VKSACDDQKHEHRQHDQRCSEVGLLDEKQKRDEGDEKECPDQRRGVERGFYHAQVLREHYDIGKFEDSDGWNERGPRLSHRWRPYRFSHENTAMRSTIPRT